MRSKGVRRVAVVVALVAVMVVGRVQPAGAFLSALDPAGWAVVAQMAAVISQAVAIKRQVENVRNQARAEFFGKLAPLTGKLGVAADWLQTSRGRVMTAVYDPAAGILDQLPVFNRVPEECGTVPAGEWCMPPAEDAALSEAAIDDVVTVFDDVVSDNALAGVLSPQARTRLSEVSGRVRDGLEAESARVGSAAERAQRRRAAARMAIEERMGVIEDWRGCQAVPDGDLPDPADERLPCMTNRGQGLGSAAEGGTSGLASDFAVKLEALDAYQDGDISKVQLDTMQTQLLIMLSRLQAQRIEREAVELEQAQEDAVAAEALRRRRIALAEADLRCKATQGWRSYSLDTPWSPASPTGGNCLVVRDVRAAATTPASAGCLLAGAC